jgi:hypothetical protein
MKIKIAFALGLLTFMPCSFSAGMSGWDRNVYDATQWASMEAYGAVFLPAALYRYGTTVYTSYTYGTTIYTDFSQYWTSTPYNGSIARAIYFAASTMATTQAKARYEGCSVRLVR